MATITGDRPEIVTAVKDRITEPLGLIGHRLFPVIPVADKTGDLYFKQVTPDASAETRSDEYADWSPERITEGVLTFAAAEIGKMYEIPESREKTYGGVDACDRIGVTAACRSVLRAHETAVVGKVLNATTYAAAQTLTANDVLSGLTDAAFSIGRYYGGTALVASKHWFNLFAKQTDVQNRMIALIGNAFSRDFLNSALSNEPSAAVAMLKAFLPFDEIIVGDDEFWAPYEYNNAAVVAKLLPESVSGDSEEFEMISREFPILGGAVWWQPDPSDNQVRFSCRSFFNEHNDNNTYKAKGWYQLQVFNAGAVQVVKLGDLATTTTTTTTTTSSG